MFKDIFTFDDVIDSNDSFICFGTVRFIKDFGPFKSGDKLEALHVDYDEATFIEQDEDGNDKSRTCSFSLEANV